ncbi:glyoxalase-like protein [Beauveria bassiana ARSEF 2860]|uniref:Glyoxalase-like protein n=1 Tax=Beauveria bassiana (strain ARSEF 2860) TaxID=655819 RepID=J4UGG7_BEAB2|nr:glyoxalase-like protein [Beauveria bassiana ARSEF 2860]EJP61947.1 glyoxalase-like protein [Beauveria bassiana ARSEF 2860]
MTSTQQDHVVLLVDDAVFENLPSWVTDNFTVTPGGYHDGQSSRNKLVLFADGSYLEFFNWYGTPPSLDDVHLPMRFWGPKTPGLIDFAVTDTTHSAEESVSMVNQRLSEEPDKDPAGLGVKFGNPVAGSRKKANGVEIAWTVTRPEFSEGDKTPAEKLFVNGRIDVPFFCHDVTPRADRVPSHEEDKTTHPCGATGIAACEILVPSHLRAEYAAVYAKVLGSKLEPADGQGAHTLDIGVPQGPTRSAVVVRAAQTEHDIRRMQERGIGFSDLVIAVKSDGPGSGARRPLGSTGIESTIWLEKTE